jgi:hypothetical protein
MHSVIDHLKRYRYIGTTTAKRFKVRYLWKEIQKLRNKGYLIEKLPKNKNSNNPKKRELRYYYYGVKKKHGRPLAF